MNLWLSIVTNLRSVFAQTKFTENIHASRWVVHLFLCSSSESKISTVDERKYNFCFDSE